MFRRRRSPAHRQTTKENRWSFPKLAFGGALIILLGTGLILYPHVASWFSQYNQSKLIVDTTEKQKDLGPAEINHNIADAREYNRLLVGGAIIEANTNVATGQVESEGAFDYYDLLNATESGVMGRLRVDSIGVDLPVYHGTADSTLEKGVGHLRGTSLPVGGESQHPVLTAHRGFPEATLFNDLDKVVVGDTFNVEVFGEVFTYQVMETKVIDPDDTESIAVVPGEDLMSLLTCTPLGINTHRILVTGERVEPTPISDLEAAGSPPEIPGFPWWAIISTAVLLSALAYVWRAGYRVQPAEKIAKDSAPLDT